MKTKTARATAYIAIVLALYASAVTAQTRRTLGTVQSISGKTVIADIGDVQVSVGDEVEVTRRQNIVDPVTEKVRGEREIVVASGVVVDISLGSVNIRINNGGESDIEIGDIVVLTGRGKKISRPSGPRYAEIQEIRDDDTIVTNFGSSDEISEGDVFLIQRTEPVYDPDTKEITGTNTVNVGRYTVETIGEGESVARVLEQNMQPLSTDIVYKENEYLEYLASMNDTSPERIRSELDSLKTRVRILENEVNELRTAHAAHIDDFEMLKSDIENMVDQLVTGGIGEIRLLRKNNEPAHAAGKTASPELLDAYGKALSLCLEREFEKAIPEFEDVIRLWPGSKYTENCRYWIAQSYYGLGLYPQASQGFSMVLDDTRFDHKDDDASIMLGITYYRMKEYDKARAEFERFISAYPESEYRSRVRYWAGLLPS